MGMSQRRKGKVGEREFRDVLIEHGWPEAKRGQQRSGLEQADVVGGPGGIHFEVKRVEKLNVHAAYRQAQADAKAGEVPVVAMRRNGEEWLAVVDARFLLRLLRASEQAGWLDVEDLL